ncbi:MAG: hypothetical protein OXT70_03725 [Chloroflexota bacterium]|nr:hypothetical protein [Chloroflexota bacterium]
MFSSYPGSGDHGVGVTGVEGSVGVEGEVVRRVVAELLALVLLEDGELIEDVVGVVLGESVEVEEEGVESGTELASLGPVADEGLTLVAEIAAEVSEVVGGVGQPDDMVAD